MMESVRKIIREVLEETLINERLMKVDDDVDYIYDTYFREDFEEIERTGKIREHMFKVASLSTSELKSELARKSDELNPCEIVINTYSNYYKPSASLISISAPRNAIDFINDFNGDIKSAAEVLDHIQSKSIFNEFKPSTIKGSIHHELVHWIDDTLHNKHISNTISNRAAEAGKNTHSFSNINTHKIELQSQIHNIHQLKRNYEDVWDELTFGQMISLSPVMNGMALKFDDEIKKKWEREIKTRMHREGLLGKNMIN